MPSENGLTVFDADTQETSYGIWFLDGLAYIFDTHRKGRRYVATLELLTEVLEPVRVSGDRIHRFNRDARAGGLLPIPYSACFFKGNLHVYTFSGPVRGFDLAAIGDTAVQSERALMQRANRLKSRVPAAIARAQRELLEGKRRPLHDADLRVLRARLQKESAGPRCPARATDFMRTRTPPVDMATEPSERALLLELAKDSFRQQIAKRVRPLARSYVEKWMKCELWLYSSVVQRHTNELHSYKTVVLQTLRTTSVDDMLAICRTTRPDLTDLWSKPAARAKLQKEIEKAIEAVEAA